MDLLKKNLASIERSWGIRVKKEIMNYIENERKSIYNIYSLDAKDGNKSLVFECKEESIRLNSVYQPIKEAERWVKQFDFRRRNKVVTMFGFGNGYFVRELLKNLEEDYLIIYEPCSEIFHHVLEEYDLTDLIENQKIKVIIKNINDYDFETQLSRLFDFDKLKSHFNCNQPFYEKIFSFENKKYQEAITLHIQQVIVNRQTENNSSKMNVGNVIHNLRYLSNAHVISDYIGDFNEEVPAILVSSGPSLDKNIDILKAAKNWGVIFAMDSAVKYLIRKNIQPDFIVTLDPMKSTRHFDIPESRFIPLFCVGESNSVIMSKHQGTKIFYNYSNLIGDIYLHLGKVFPQIGTGGSVATGAFSICIALGFKKIILVGQDLAYGTDSTHAGGVNIAYPNTMVSDIQVEDIYGNMIRSRYDWFVYRNWFEHAISVYKGDIEVIDATEGGAKIHGTVILTLEDAIREYCTDTIDCQQLVKNKPASLTEEQIRDAKKLIDTSVEDLDKIKTMLKKAQGICSSVIADAKINVLSQSKLKYYLKKLTKINDFIENRFVYRLLNEYIGAEFDDKVGDIDDLEKGYDSELVITYKKTFIFYQILEKAVQEIEPLLIRGNEDYVI